MSIIYCHYCDKKVIDTEGYYECDCNCDCENYICEDCIGETSSQCEICLSNVCAECINYCFKCDKFICYECSEKCKNINCDNKICKKCLKKSLLSIKKTINYEKNKFICDNCLF